MSADISNQLERRFRTAASFFAVLVSLLGFSVLVGWEFDIDFVKRPFFEHSTMNPLPAVFFLLSGIILLILNTKDLSGRQKITIAIPSILIAVGGLIVFSKISLAQPWQLDGLLFFDKVRDSTGEVVHPMARNGALNFALLGISFLISTFNFRYGKLLANHLVLIFLLMASFAIVGYLYHVEEFIGVLQYFPMAFHGAIGFVMCGLSLLFINRDAGFMKIISSRSLGGTIARVLVPASVIVPVLVGYLRLVMQWRNPVSIELGVAFLITCIIALFFLLVVRVSYIINQRDKQKDEAEVKLASANVELERKVVLRTADLTRSELRFQALIENSADCITLSDENFVPTYQSPAAESVMGYSLAERRMMSTVEIVHPDDLENFRITSTKFFSSPGVPIAFQAQIKHKNGHYIWVEGTINNLLHDVNVASIVTNYREITARKVAEDNLLSSEQRFRALIENSSDAILLTDENLNPQYQSPAVERMTGISLQRRLANPNVKYSHPDDLPLIQGSIKKAIAQPGVPVPFTTRFLHLDGHYIWIEGVMTNLMKDQNVRALVFNYRDVSGRKKSEELQALYASIVGSSDDAILSKSLDDKITSWNRGAEKLYGYSAHEVLGKDIGMLIPSDLEDEEPIITARILANEQVEHYETRRLRKDGTPIEISLTVSPIKDEKNNIIGASKIAHDISKRKEAERKLATSEQRFRALIENNSDAIVMNDENSKLMYQSPSVTRILGYSWEEREGTNVLDYIHPDDREDFVVLYKDLKTKHNQPIPFQYRFRHKKGHFVWLQGVVTNLTQDPNVGAIVSNYRDISSEKEASERILRERTLLRTMIDNLPDYIYVKDMESKHLINNKAMVTLLGASSEAETLGKTSIDFFGRDVASPYLAEDEDILKTGKELIDFEESTITPAGEHKHLLTTKVPLRDSKGEIVGLVGISRDITRQKATELDLRNSKYLLEKAQEVGQIGNWTLDLKTTPPTISWSKETRQIFEKKEGEFDGSIDMFESLIHAEDVNRVTQARDRSIKFGSLYAVDFRIHVGKDLTKWVHVQGDTTHDETGKPIMLVGIIQDITERKLAEAEILNLNEGLEQTVAQRTSQLEMVNKELEAFSYSVSHDLRAPLRIIDGFCHILVEDYYDKLDEEGRKTVDTITKNAKKMGQLIDDLLNFSKMSRTQLHWSPINMTALAKDSLHDLASGGMKLPASLILHELRGSTGDLNLIKQVWLNLIANAIKYSSKKETPEIEIGMTTSQGREVYFVRDNGSGFDMAYSHKLFGVFQRLHKQEEFTGTGVGLALVKRILTRHGGDVWAESKLDEGATFYFYLPPEGTQ